MRFLSECCEHMRFLVFTERCTPWDKTYLEREGEREK